MLSSVEQAEIRRMIQSFYRMAGLPVWNGVVNEQVVEVFGLMVEETKKCSAAFARVPRPTGGRASVAWVLKELGRGIFDAQRQKLSETCAKATVWKWRSAMDMAEQGIAIARVPSWA